MQNVGQKEHEESLVKAFILPERRGRWLELLASPKSRKRLLSALAHHAPIDPRFSHLIPASQQSRKGIEELLRSKGAPDTCHVISEDSGIDAQELSLSDALERVQDYGTFLSCIAGRLAYFQFEDVGHRYILER
jgi:hypothetical protein